MGRIGRFVAVFLFVALSMPARDAKSVSPYDQGRFRATVRLGMTSTFDSQYFVVGGAFGYFVLDGLELGLGGDFWLVGSPAIGRVSPQIRYVLYFVPGVQPYVGAFYRHWFIGSDFSDLDTLGARGGILWVIGRNLFAGLGVVYEVPISKCSGDCSWVYPELVLAITF